MLDECLDGAAAPALEALLAAHAPERLREFRFLLVGGDGMSWLAWILLSAGLMAVFVLWDLIFCGGKYCREFTERMGRQSRDDLK